MQIGRLHYIEKIIEYAGALSFDTGQATTSEVL